MFFFVFGWRVQEDRLTVGSSFTLPLRNLMLGGRVSDSICHDMDGGVLVLRCSMVLCPNCLFRGWEQISIPANLVP